MSRSNRLRNTDYAALLRILGEVADLRDPAARRRHALDALCDAIGARCGIACQTARDPGGGVRLLSPLTVRLDDAPPGLLDDYFGGRLPIDPCAPPMERLGAAAGPVAAALRRHLVPDADWYRDAHVTGMRAALGLDDGVYARIVAPGGAAHGFSLIRARGERPFTERHRQMFALFHTHAANLYRLDDPSPGPPGPLDPLARLAPRHRAVAERFLAGDSVKEAAVRLGLSRHTVIEYAKAMHRVYGVSSRAELLLALLGCDFRQ